MAVWSFYEGGDVNKGTMVFAQCNSFDRPVFVTVMKRETYIEIYISAPHGIEIFMCLYKYYLTIVRGVL